MPSFSDDLYLGRGYRAGANAGDRRGVKVTPMQYVNYGALAAALAEGIIKDATGTQLPNAETVTYTAATDGTDPQDDTTRPTKVTMNVGGTEYAVLDLGTYGRNLVTAVTHASSVVAMTVKHYGFDMYRKAVTETHAITATGTSKTVTGKKAVRYWWKTEITAAGNAESNTLDLGTGNVFGLPFRIGSLNAAIPVRDGVIDGSATKVVADANAASGTTGDVRGTVDFNTDPNGTAVYAAWVAVEDPSTESSIYGVAQA